MWQASSQVWVSRRMERVSSSARIARREATPALSRKRRFGSDSFKSREVYLVRMGMSKSLSDLPIWPLLSVLGRPCPYQKVTGQRFLEKQVSHDNGAPWNLRQPGRSALVASISLRGRNYARPLVELGTLR